MYKAPKATFSYEHDASSQNSNHYHCFKNKWENVSQKSGMAWLTYPLCLWLRPWFTVKQAS